MFGASKSEKQLKELRESMERIEHSFKKLEIEWAETYDKFRQLHWRVAKRVKALEVSEPQEPESLAPAQTGGEGPSLTSGQAEWQRKILARRNRMPSGAQNGGG